MSSALLQATKEALSQTSEGNPPLAGQTLQYTSVIADLGALSPRYVAFTLEAQRHHLWHKFDEMAEENQIYVVRRSTQFVRGERNDSTLVIGRIEVGRSEVMEMKLLSMPQTAIDEYLPPKKTLGVKLGRGIANFVDGFTAFYRSAVG